MKFTFDIEDYYKNFCRYQLNENINFNNDFYYNTIEISNYLKSKNITGIFYILGNVAENYPNLVKVLKDDKHIIGLHGYDHKSLINFTKEDFRNDIDKCIKIFKKIDKNLEINHYRSPGFSMLKNVEDYYEILDEMNIKYSSSFTFSKFRKIKNNINFKNINELTLPSINLLILEYKFTGGSYFRITPYFVIDFLLKFFGKENIIFYFHPYDFFYNSRLDPFKYIKKRKINIIFKYLRNYFYNFNTKNNKKKFYKTIKKNNIS